MFPAHVRHYTAAFLQDFALSAGFSVVPFFIFDYLGGGAAMSGTISAIQSFCYGMVCLIIAPLLGRTQRGLSWAALGSVLFGALLLLGPLTTRHPVVYAIINVIGLVSLALFWPAMQAWLGGVRDPFLRSRRIGYYNIAWCLGLATGPLAAGPLYDIDYRLAFGMVLIVSWISALIVRSLPQHAHVPSPTDNDTPAETEADPASEMHLYVTWLASFVGWLLVGVTRSVFPKRVDELVAAGELTVGWGANAMGIDAGAAVQYSWLAFVLYASRALVSLVMGRIDFWRHRFALLAALQVCAGGAFWLLGVTESLLLMALACTVVGINGGVSFFASLEYSVANTRLGNSRAAIHEAMVGLGGSLGSITFGYLAGLYGTGWPFRHTPYLIAAALVVQFALFQAAKRRAQT